MDRMRSLGDSAHDATPVEDGLPPESDATPPPMIGTDERRMHVRAYNFWANLLGDRNFPAIEDLDLDAMGDFGSHTVLLDFTSGIDNPALAFVGETLAQACELDTEVAYIADVPRRSLLSRLTDHYLQIIANRAPIGFEAEFTNQEGALILYRGVLLPFSSDDDTIDFILGVINWKQAAEPVLASALAQEVEAAAAAATPPRPTMPLWADGPASDVAAGMPEPAQASALPDHDMEPAVPLADELAELPPLADAPQDEDMSLADRLAAARECATLAVSSEARGHKALYEAIGRAWAFAAAVPQAEEDYAEMLEDAGLKPSTRSPMTTVARLVFGNDYDKTRIAEVVTVLRFAEREQLSPAMLVKRLSGQAGGIKQLVRDERRAERADRPVIDRYAAAVHAIGNAPALASVHGLAPGDAHVRIAVLRRNADGSEDVVHIVPDAAARRMLERLAIR